MAANRPMSALTGRSNKSALPGPDSENGTVRLPLRRLRGGLNKRQPPKANQFTHLVEHTVDALKGGVEEASFEDVQRILVNIRRQFDEVHAEADKRENDLVEVRREIKILEAMSKVEEDVLDGFTRSSTIAKIEQATSELEEALETRKVYRHMSERLRRELSVYKEKVGLMEAYLQRKTTEVHKRQEDSRRIHEGKVNYITQLEDMEQDIQLERMACGSAMTDLEAAMTRRRNEVRHREEFERWRYEVALEAATEAFEATAGRYRKIYAIEKLTGNCLQKLTFEQATFSQATEDGFQKIREVTGLTDVMDIVHKFLNRDMEHEQLRNAAREAETKLHSLREAEASRPPGEDVTATFGARPETRGLGTEVTEFEQILDEARRDHLELRRNVKDGTLLLDSIEGWTHKISKSLSTVATLAHVHDMTDLPAFFTHFLKTVTRFLDGAHAEMPDTRLVKMTSEALSRVNAEQQRLLLDKEFVRANCRIYSSADQNKSEEIKRGKKDGIAFGVGDDEVEQEFTSERERLKSEASSRAAEHYSRAPKGNTSPRSPSHRRAAEQP
eukprot:TRINITY_DN45251_c0_g1_i1.p1 TRINITY_DN45251_c0_g1~~TRINITY_DN45251_c0_g1_i1.p1  ORF type:complete len:558 (-),score=110.11 TRINITY_DN45251_c0_g1_i1:60-1733(-)